MKKLIEELYESTLVYDNHFEQLYSFRIGDQELFYINNDLTVLMSFYSANPITDKDAVKIFVITHEMALHYPRGFISEIIELNN